LEEDIDLAGEAEDRNEAVKMAQDLCPDVVIMDITMPNSNGIDAVKQIKKSIPETRIMILWDLSDIVWKKAS
jgi:YesN/AraC family two-component response regulator